MFDASSSMSGEKIAAAKAAGIAFIRSIRLPEDRVGIASFSRDSRVAHGLSGDAVELEATIRALEISPGTRIDRGLEAGLEVLADARDGDDVTSVLILLTDGIQEVEPDLPRTVADRIRSEGIVLHVVGLGADVDVAALRELVRSAAHLHLSPGAAQLEAIYTGIATTIPCLVEAFWGRR